MNIIWSLLVGGLVGWLAAKFMKTSSNLVRNVVIGIVGGFIGHLLFGLIGLTSSGIIGQILISTVGACALIWGINKFSK
jgi:uncharacterized membrane protein YeaQ/YmgE (transglycosylase-associated protein family)